MSRPLDRTTPGRPPKVPFFGWERYVFMFLCSKNCACGHPLISNRSICRKTQNRVNLGLRRRIFMSKTHICLGVFIFYLGKIAKMYSPGGQAIHNITPSDFTLILSHQLLPLLFCTPVCMFYFQTNTPIKITFKLY
jgi:hypothetical protein